MEKLKTFFKMIWARTTPATIKSLIALLAIIVGDEPLKYLVGHDWAWVVYVFDMVMGLAAAYGIYNNPTSKTEF